MMTFVYAMIGFGFVVYKVGGWFDRWNASLPSKNERLVALALLGQGEEHWSELQLMWATGLCTYTVRRYVNKYEDLGWASSDLVHTSEPWAVGGLDPDKTSYWLTPEGRNGIKNLLDVG